MLSNQKKEWSKPKIILMSNSSIQGGTSTASFSSEFVASYCSGTCATPTYTFSTGTNSTAVFCTASTAPACS
jgi:hypothetical protein